MAISRPSAAKVCNSTRRRRSTSLDSSLSEEDTVTLKDTRRSRGKRQKASAILNEFTSLDALLSSGLAEKRKRENRERKLKHLREESELKDKDAPIGKLISCMDDTLSALSGDNHLFTSSEVTITEEKFGYVFMPMTEPLPFRTYKATESELQSELKLVYEIMQSSNDEELRSLLWSKAILVRCMLVRKNEAMSADSSMTTIRVPSKIGFWLFMTMSTHSSSHVVGGCFSNLLFAHRSKPQVSISSLLSALPVAYFAHPIEVSFDIDFPPFDMEWKPSIYDFLNAFRAYGFQDSKRSMSVKSKISETPPSTIRSRVLPFPTVNMHYVLMYMVLCLRTKTLILNGYDAFSFTMFFLRMQFESNIHASIIDLTTICIEELLDAFPRTEWRREWAPQLVLRIAGLNEGLFDYAAGWLAVARSLPRTMRGTQLTTGLAIYVLQHRIDKVPQKGALSEKPLKFPIQSGLVVDIVAGIVEDLTQKYVEIRKRSKEAKAKPPFDLLCKKIALMDLALQTFLNVFTPAEMKIMLDKLDRLADAHKSTMSAKWHELKTLISLMHRKYSLENLSVGRSQRASPSARSALTYSDDE
ncbi:uncharacterized protein CCR75_003443 [Bremia lactucae]|uniref:Uncharacterized protein n=1 Tax=Bremia lactucae TaxID=4779 RepID=A0A976NY73_BRELC|nr:hypothetical protein CCR75_003443 [Bremia lactucae]